MIAMNRNDNAFAMSFLGENMMAAVDALELPSVLWTSRINSLPETCFI